MFSGEVLGLIRADLMWNIPSEIQYSGRNYLWHDFTKIMHSNCVSKFSSEIKAKKEKRKRWVAIIFALSI